MANNKKTNRAVINVISKALSTGEGKDNKFNLKCTKEVNGDVRIYDLFQNDEMIYSVAIANNWEYAETIFEDSEIAKEMSREVIERITESKEYGFSDI